MAVLRVVVLLNAVVLDLIGFGDFERPGLGASAIVVLLGWTAVVSWAYAVPARRRWGLLTADLVVTVGLILLTPLVVGPGVTATLPGFATMGALLSWAVHLRWSGGLVAGLVLAAADLSIRDEVTQSVYGNVFLLVIGGPVVGFLVGSLQLMATERDVAERAAAAAAERARLARAVHDGVLQVLALVQRRGREIGGPAADLARLCGEQERTLRRLIREQDFLAFHDGPGDGPATQGRRDLAAMLARLESREGVVVATPGRPVQVAAPLADELVAAAAACLDNVVAHVGSGAKAWVLLEETSERLEVTVRDEGPGIPPGRLEQARDQGRLGVSESICGRLHDLGGSATLDTGAHGSEWLLVVPVQKPVSQGPRA